MPKVKNHVRLSSTKRNRLEGLISKGAATAKSIMHANVLLATDEISNKGRMREAESAELLYVSKQTVHTIRQLYS